MQRKVISIDSALLLTPWFMSATVSLSANIAFETGDYIIMNINKKKLFALVSTILVVIFWGYSFVSTKIVLAELPPISIAFFRQVIASVVLIAVLCVKKLFVKMRIRDLLILSLSSFFGIVLYFIFENTGLKYTTASNGSIIVAAVPIFTLVTEYLFYKFKVTSKLIICLIISIIGVVLVIFEQGSFDFSSGSTKGNLLIIGAMASWVVYTIICKRLSDKYKGIVITTYQMISASILFIPFVLPEIDQWQRISAYSMLNLLYLAIFCSALAYYLFNNSIKVLGATVSSMFLNLIPVVSIIGGVIILKETISPLQIGGMLLIMLSLFLVGSKQREQ